MTDNFLQDIDSSWTLFLDRDGVINKRVFGGYITSEEEFEFLPGVLDSIKFFTNYFNRIIIITNQQGVGKGIMTESDLEKLHDFMLAQIVLEGGCIDSIYYCTELVSTRDSCRKPSDKMAMKAVADFPDIILEKSIMIGDSLSDIEFGINAGMKTVFITSSGNDYKAEKLANINSESLKDFKQILETETK